jgi:hypothetical protein
MNLKQMVARVMRALPTMAPGAIGEPDIVDMLNQGQLHLSRVVSKFIVSEFELEADYNIVPFPDDLLTMNTVYWTSDAVERELYPAKDKMPIGNESPLTIAVSPSTSSTYSDEATTEPTKYYTKGGRIYVYPIPRVAGTVSIAYIPKPTEMADDDDTPDLEGSDNYLIAFALHRLHLEAGSPLLQLWEMEKGKEEFTFLQTTDQNYRTPFQVEMRW